MRTYDERLLTNHSQGKPKHYIWVSLPILELVIWRIKVFIDETYDFFLKLPMNIKYWFGLNGVLYHRYWYNPIFYRNPDDPKGWFYRLMMKVYKYKEVL